VWQIAHEHDALDGREGFEEVKVLVVVRCIGALEAGGKLPEEELEDVLELVLGIRGVGGVEPEDVGETAGGVRLDAPVLVEEEGGVDELRAGGGERADVDELLVEFCELGVEGPELLEERVGGERLADDLFVERELLGRRRGGARLGHHRRAGRLARPGASFALSEIQVVQTPTHADSPGSCRFGARQHVLAIPRTKGAQALLGAPPGLRTKAALKGTQNRRPDPQKVSAAWGCARPSLPPFSSDAR